MPKNKTIRQARKSAKRQVSNIPAKSLSAAELTETHIIYDMNGIQIDLKKENRVVYCTITNNASTHLNGNALASIVDAVVSSFPEKPRVKPYLDELYDEESQQRKILSPKINLLNLALKPKQKIVVKMHPSASPQILAGEIKHALVLLKSDVQKYFAKAILCNGQEQKNKSPAKFISSPRRPVETHLPMASSKPVLRPNMSSTEKINLPIKTMAKPLPPLLPKPENKGRVQKNKWDSSNAHQCCAQIFALRKPIDLSSRALPKEFKRLNDKMPTAPLTFAGKHFSLFAKSPLAIQNGLPENSRPNNFLAIK
jgi:hypothetical protein